MENHKQRNKISALIATLVLLIALCASYILPTNLSISKYVFNVLYTIGATSSSSFPLTAIGTISGTLQVGQTLTAGTLTPSSATADYQWQSSSKANGTYNDISGATASTYTLAAGDSGIYIRVKASGNGDYTGSVTSASVGPIQAPSALSLTAIGAISGVPQVSQVLTAGEISPSGATASYQWMRCNQANGTYTNITGATSNTYTLTNDDFGNYIEIVATGTGSYSGTATSPAFGPVGSGALTGISNIIGNTLVDSVLTAGTVTPLGATVSYQWMVSDDNGNNFTDISGATSSTYKISSSWNNKYIRVRATGIGSFTGTVTSASTISRVGTATIPITNIGATSGSTQVEGTLTAGDLTPTYAVATFQWYKCLTSNGTFTSISGATASTYSLGSSDFGYYFKVVAIGSGSYTGTVQNSPVGPITRGVVSGIGDITGTAASGQTLTAGAVSPSGATVNYQWQKSNTAYGTYTDISGATSSSYALGTNNTGYYFRVTVTGNGNFSGSATSNIIGPVISGSATPITAIGTIYGNLNAGQIIYAGVITPTDATVTYQWMRCAVLGGTYANISGATSSSYTLTSGDYGYYITVRASGTGSYNGTVTSSEVGPVQAYQLTAISDIIGNTYIGKALTAGTVTPLGATVTYQWQRDADGTGTTFSDIGGATSSSFTLSGPDSYRYLRVKAIGTGAYTGTVISNMTAGRGGTTATSIGGIGSISGALQVGKTLTAGALTTSGATATYQWLRCTTSNGSFASIPGATSSTYTLTSSDYGYYIEVTATGSGYFCDAYTSAPRGPVSNTTISSISNIVGTAAAGQVLTAGTVTPSGATVSYQWQSSLTSGGTYANVNGATDSTYYLGAGDVGNYLRVVVTGTGGYTGSVTSTCTGPVFSGSATAITGIGSIIGTAQVGSTITAGALTPSGATATYQWMRSSASGGIYTNIQGATLSTYTLIADDYNNYIKVKVSGSGSYSGTVTSAATGIVTACPITAISDVIGSVYTNMTMTAGTVTPVGATVYYQWQIGDWNYNYSYDLNGATAKYFALDGSLSGKTIRVKVTGYGAYSGTVYSNWSPGRIAGGTPTAISSIGNISGTAKVGNVLTAGTASPSGSTVTYQWMRCQTSGGDYENIAGATGSTYTPVSADVGYYIKVTVTGSGYYAGIVTSSATGAVIS